MRSALQGDVKLSFSPNRPNLLVQEISGFFGIQGQIVVPQNFCEHKPQLCISQVASDTIPDTNGPGLEGGVVVIWVHPFVFVEMAFWDKFLRLGEVVISEVGT